jgi:hypothetical protein
VFSASVASVSMSLVLRGAKKLRVIIVLVCSLPAADFGAYIVDFLAVCEVSLEICLLRFYTSWKSSSLTADSNEDLVTATHCPACAFTFRTAFSSFSVSVYMPQKALKSGFPSRILQKFALFSSALSQ